MEEDIKNIINELHEKLKKLKISIKIKKHVKNERYVGERKEYIEIIKKNGKQKIPYNKFMGYLNTIGHRFMLSMHCKEEISKHCKNVENLSHKEIKAIVEKHNEKINIKPETQIQIEYFIFAIKSCLDIVAQVINLCYELKIDEYEVNIKSIKNNIKNLEENKGLFTLLMEDIDGWISDLKEIRNMMTHHDLLGTSSVLIEDFKEKRNEYNGLVLKIPEKIKDKVNGKLPDYFEGLLDNTHKLLKVFYSEINTLEFVLKENEGS